MSTITYVRSQDTSISIVFKYEKTLFIVEEVTISKTDDSTIPVEGYITVKQGIPGHVLTMLPNLDEESCLSNQVDLSLVVTNHLDDTFHTLVSYDDLVLNKADLDPLYVKDVGYTNRFYFLARQSHFTYPALLEDPMAIRWLTEDGIDIGTISKIYLHWSDLANDEVILYATIDDFYYGRYVPRSKIELKYPYLNTTLELQDLEITDDIGKPIIQSSQISDGTMAMVKCNSLLYVKEE